MQTDTGKFDRADDRLFELQVTRDTGSPYVDEFPINGYSTRSMSLAGVSKLPQDVSEPARNMVRLLFEVAAIYPQSGGRDTLKIVSSEKIRPRKISTEHDDI